MKIGLCGTMSVGKTTLVKELQKLKYFKDYEFATERSKYLSSLGIPLNTDSTLRGQVAFLTERISEVKIPKIITDRTVIDVIAFSLNSKSMNDREKQSFENLASKFIENYDHIFYINPEGTIIEDNGVRETNKLYRATIDRTIQILIEKYKDKMKNFSTIKGSTEDRIEQILSILRPIPFPSDMYIRPV